jgi:hypothetical protein
MTQIAEEILKSFQGLPEDEQSAVVDQLCESLWKAKLKSVDAANWQAFLEERIAAADRGEFAEGTADDVFLRVRESLAKGQPQ